MPVASFELLNSIYYRFAKFARLTLVNHVQLLCRIRRDKRHADIRGRRAVAKTAVAVLAVIVGRQIVIFGSTPLEKVVPGLCRNQRQIALVR